MFFEIVSWAAVAFLMITSAGLLLTRDWRWSLGLLAAQYLGVFWLVRMHWPISMAAVKLVTGWMLATILPGIGLAEVAGSLLLLGMGLLHLGMTIQPLRVIIGLLTILAGFEMLYAAVETSTLVAALLAVINLGLALVGSYLLTAGPEKIGENG
ncbi:MAG: hypothetical protein B5M51_03245 [Anaerolinea sp. 4484_236]|nr:MAG: hypothetical protein B5M51_03245 [Anaerolinea sp. 4484_236]